MKRILTIALCVAIAATGCKKKEEPKKKNNTGTTTSGTTTGGTTTGGTTTGGSTTGGPGTPTNATSFSGAFTTLEGEMSAMGYSVSINSASAWFSSTPTATLSGIEGIEVGSVHFNNLELEFDSLQGMYISESNVAFATETWSVTGNSIIPSFLQSNPQSRPTTVKVSSLPSTITKANGLTINLGTLSNFKVGTIFISDGTGNPGGIIVQQLAPGANSITLSSSQLNGFQVGQQTGSIMIMLENGHSLHINGKNFYFSQQMSSMTNISIN